MKILLIEDDESVAQALRGVLERHGHHCLHVRRGDDGLRLHDSVDVVLLDLGLADGDGFPMLQRLRHVSQVPVLIVSARSDERSIVRGLNLGADDYLVKPVRMAELMARLGVVTRRRRADRPSGIVEVGDVTINLVTRTVEVAGQEVSLTAKELAIVEALAKRPGEAVRKELVLDEVWGDASSSTSRACDVHIAGVRAKLERPDLIHTIRGFGYRLGE